MNPLHPSYLRPLERRAELCRILALGLVRLMARQSSGLSDGKVDSSLPSGRHPSGHATTQDRRVA